MARRRKRKFVREEELAPKIAQGLTQDASLEEALQEHPIQGGSGVDHVKHMRDVTHSGTRGVPTPKFVAEESLDSVWRDEPTGRLQRDATLIFQPEVMNALRAGEICLRCLEPQPEPFPVVCQSPPEMGCNYPIKDRQVLDITMEFEGGKHLGPTKPITEYMEELEDRREKREALARQKSGGRGISVSKKVYSPGAAREKLAEPPDKPEIIMPPGVKKDA